MEREDQRHDPYGGCTATCPHDLAAGVLVAELLRTDGPHVALILVDGRRGAMPIIPLRRAG